MSSLCSAATPLIACVPTTQRFAIRTYAVQLRHTASAASLLDHATLTMHHAPSPQPCCTARGPFLLEPVRTHLLLVALLDERHALKLAAIARVAAPHDVQHAGVRPPRAWQRRGRLKSHRPLQSSVAAVWRTEAERTTRTERRAALLASGAGCCQRGSAKSM